MRALVIGVGNLLRTDDGAGIHVITRLNELYPEIKTLDAGIVSIEIIEAIRGYDRVIIIDAIDTGSEPGTIYNVKLIDGDAPQIITHSHGTNLLTVLKLGNQLYGDEMPKEIILLAIEADDTTTIGDKPTQKVGEAIAKVVELVSKYLDIHRL